MARKQTQRRGLQVIYPDCAGIDIGANAHWVAIDPSLDERPTREFGSETEYLEQMADWLIQSGVRQVAMEATGVYWIAVYELLERRGLHVMLVDTRSTRQVSGRKSDVLDCEWIQQLMSCGLLRAAFRPGDDVCTLRALVRVRAQLVRDSSRAVLHMQKALTQMNVHLGKVLSDIVGKTGLAILRAIVAGERDGARLAALRDRRVRADEAQIARALHGNWRHEHLFALSLALRHYDFLATQIVACEGEILAALVPLARIREPAIPSSKPLRSKHRSTSQNEVLRVALHRALGVDLTQIPTIAVETALVICSEIGHDLHRFPDSAHFCSWLQLAPPTRISGGKPLPGLPPKRFNRAGQALRLAAANARNSDSFIGAAHRARLARMDKPSAIKATAHHLARLVYAVLTKGETYIERGIAGYNQLHRARQVTALRRRARQLGFAVTPVESAA
jgi:transposase